MKKFLVKNYKGNLVESLGKFQKAHSDLRITEATQNNNELTIVAEKKMSREELDNFINGLNKGAVQFQYYKKDGSLRNACGTRMEALMADEDIKVLKDELSKPSIDFLIPYYDFQSKGVRKFHVSRFIKIVDTADISGSSAAKVKNAIDKGAFDDFDIKDNCSLVGCLKAVGVVLVGGSSGGSGSKTFGYKEDDKVRFFQDLEYKVRRILHQTSINPTEIDKTVSDISHAVDETLESYS